MLSLAPSRLLHGAAPATVPTPLDVPLGVDVTSPAAPPAAAAAPEDDGGAAAAAPFDPLQVLAPTELLHLVSQRQAADFAVLRAVAGRTLSLSLSSSPRKPDVVA